jgi:hypothetical protein
MGKQAYKDVYPFVLNHIEDVTKASDRETPLSPSTAQDRG